MVITIKKFFDDWAANNLAKDALDESILCSTESEPDMVTAHFIQTDWLIQEINMNNLENKYNIAKHPEQEWSRWKLFKSKYQLGDKVYEFDSPSEYWESLSGSAGYVILRNGKIVAELITMEN